MDSSETSSVVEKIKSFIKTICLFVFFCLSLPFFGLCFLVQTFVENLWITILQKLYPRLYFSQVKNIRSTLDTGRNPAIFHFLIKVIGNCDPELVRMKLQLNLLDRKTKFGYDEYFTLKSRLVTCWGKFAWKILKPNKFDINNHLLLHSSKRRQGITERNVQEYISETTSKHLPSDLPQWQIHLVPIPKADSYYILFRIHHLILDEHPNLHINDFLMINNATMTHFNPESYDRPEDEETLKNVSRTRDATNSPFHKQINQFKYIPELWSRISSTICNRWNEFIYNYDPLESPDCHKQVLNGITQLYSVMLIMIVTIVCDFFRHFDVVRNDPRTKLRFLINLSRREIKKRNFTLTNVGNAILVSLDPLNILRSFLIFWLWIGKCTIMIPFQLGSEFLALRSCLLIDNAKSPDTIIGCIFEYTPLLYGVVKELFSLIRMILTAARQLYDNFIRFDGHTNLKHYLQKVSFCGRKVIAWSDPITRDEIAILENKHGFSESEIILSAISYTLENHQFNLEPENGATSNITFIPTTIKCIPDCNILKKHKSYESLLNFKLPLDSGYPYDKLSRIRKEIERSRKNQAVLRLLEFGECNYNLLSKFIPLAFGNLLLNYVSRRFPVTVTEMIESGGDAQEYFTAWGHQICDFIYFRPPQGNISLSLTIQRFGENIRLGVIGDAEISPNHTKIANNFVKYFHEII